MINTHKGHFMYTWLCFGIASSPGLFQQIINQLIQEIPKTVAYLNDILILGQTMEEHNSNLHAVLKRLQHAGLHLRSNKCEFKKLLISYLGYSIDSEEINLTQEKVNAIRKAPTPRMCQNCIVFLAFVNYYHCYLNNISTVLTPLYKSLQKGILWKWALGEGFTFEQSKELLMSTNVLVHYNAKLKIITLPVGVDPVLLHIMAVGSEKPIYLASRILSRAEQNYAEQEGLAVIFGVSKFYKYIYGQEFTIIMDHKPLLGLFKEDCAISPTGNARVQCSALVLVSYHYQIWLKNFQFRWTESATCRGLCYTITMSGGSSTFHVSFRLNASHAKNCCFLYSKRSS